MESLRPFFRPGSRVLEIGGGNGYQARLLSDFGLEVSSIDVDAGVAGETYFSVQIYDGRTLPFEDASFDHVFSSNTLEHVRDIPRLNAEIRRVLRPGGTAIHVMPSSAWRAWTNVTHYLYLFKYLVQRKHSVPTHKDFSAAGASKRSMGAMIRRAMFPGPHGENSSSLAELITFSSRHWRRIFERDGFRVLRAEPCHMFYTGYGILGAKMSPATRRRLAFLGSATNTFVVSPA